MANQDVQVMQAAVAAPFSGDGLAELPPELQTGHKHLDAEHALLLKSIQTLRRVCVDQHRFHHCGNCDHERHAQCESDLVSLLGDLLAFILDHFRTEEAIMRDSLMIMVDRDVCEAHMEDHAAISGKIQEIVVALDRTSLVARIGELDALLVRWVSNHIQMHDMLLVRWLERDGAALRQSLAED